MDSLTPTQQAEALHLWELWARPNQLEPAACACHGGDWQTWLILAGRGFGKTRTGAEWTIARARRKNRRIALVAPTSGDARDVMVEGESGILACSPPSFMPEYEPSKRRLTWPNGSIATTYSAEEPKRLRGPQHTDAWADEIAAWQYPDAWEMLSLGLRLGEDPRAVATTTPRMRQFLRDLIKDPTTHVTKGSTYDNRANLAPKFFARIVQKYEGTRLGQQELHADLLDVAAGAVYADYFSEAEHVIDWQWVPGCRTLLGWDFGVASPHILMAQETGDLWWPLPDGRQLPPHSLVIFDELGPDGTPTQKLIPMIARKMGGRTEQVEHESGALWHVYRGGRPVHGVYCDPAGDARDQSTGMSSVEMVRTAFGPNSVRFETTQVERHIPNGVERVQLALQPGGDQPPTLYFARTLKDNGEARGILSAIKGYAYPERKAGQAVNDLPHKDGTWDHAVDALRYLLVNAQNARNDWRGGTVYRRGYG